MSYRMRADGRRAFDSNVRWKSVRRATRLWRNELPVLGLQHFWARPCCGKGWFTVNKIGRGACLVLWLLGGRSSHRCQMRSSWSGSLQWARRPAPALHQKVEGGVFFLYRCQQTTRRSV